MSQHSQFRALQCSCGWFPPTIAVCCLLEAAASTLLQPSTHTLQSDLLLIFSTNHVSKPMDL